MASTAGATWSKEQILKLIEIWGQETIQKQLQECKRNQSIFEEVAKQMREAGYERTFQQCREKIKKLKGDYRKEKDKHNKTGEGRTNWDYFEAMDAILGHRPATVVIDTSESATPALETQEKDEEGEQPAANESDGTGSMNSSTTPLSSSLAGAGSSIRKRKRPAKTESVVVDLMERVISAQMKSDEQMLELEEKRMRMEEQQMEREAQQR